MKKAFGWGAAIICALVTASCGYIAPIVGSGKVVTTSYGLKDFHAIDASTMMNVTVVIGPEYAVSVATDDNILPHMTVKVQDGSLRLGEIDVWQVLPTKMTATVTMPALDAAMISGASTLSVSSFSSSRFSADVSGASTLYIKNASVSDFTGVVSGASKIAFDALACGSLNLDVSGASTVVAATDSAGGTALVANVSGASHAYLYKMPYDTAKLIVSGASGVEASVSASLSGEASGASTVTYRGTAASSLLCTGASSCSHI